LDWGSSIIRTTWYNVSLLFGRFQEKQEVIFCLYTVQELYDHATHSTSEPGCGVSALHFFVKQIPLMALWHRNQSNGCFFQLLIPGLTHCFTSGRGIGVWNRHATGVHSLHIYCLWGDLGALWEKHAIDRNQSTFS
jgi:hypothetical protein